MPSCCGVCKARKLAFSAFISTRVCLPAPPIFILANSCANCKPVCRGVAFEVNVADVVHNVVTALLTAVSPVIISESLRKLLPAAVILMPAVPEGESIAEVVRVLVLFSLKVTVRLSEAP